MAGKSTQRKLYTLTEVSSATGISMPTLQRYKKSYQDRIPSEGSGRKQRYPKTALAVFAQLKKENLKKRGRPRKSGSAAAAAPKKPAGTAARKVKGKTGAKAAAKSTASSGLITLTEIGKRTGISYPTLLRYVRSSLRRLPHEGKGRSRRFHPEAVPVFEAIRGENAKRRGRPSKSGGGRPAARKAGRPARAASAAASDNGQLAQRVRDLEKAQRQLLRDLTRLQKQVARPIKVTFNR